MRNWKRRTRGIRKIKKKLWFYEYLYPGVDIRTNYRSYRRNELRKKRLFASIMDEVKKRSQGKTHYEDCSYHPCLMTLLDFDNDDLKGVSLIDGTSPRSCSLLNCGVTFFTEGEATERAAYIKDHGWDQYFEHYNTFSLEDKK